MEVFTSSLGKLVRRETGRRVLYGSAILALLQMQNDDLGNTQWLIWQKVAELPRNSIVLPVDGFERERVY